MFRLSLAGFGKRMRFGGGAPGGAVVYSEDLAGGPKYGSIRVVNPFTTSVC